MSSKYLRILLVFWIMGIFLVGCRYFNQMLETNNASLITDIPTASSTLENKPTNSNSLNGILVETQTLESTVDQTSITPKPPTSGDSSSSTKLVFEDIPKGMYVVSGAEKNLLFRDISNEQVFQFEIGVGVKYASYSRNRKEMIFSGTDGKVNVLNLDSMNLEILGGIDQAYGVVWAPDESSILFTTYERLEDYDIWNGRINSFTIGSSIITKVTDATIDAIIPKWSPNGEWIAFLSDSFSKHATQHKLFLLDASCLSESIPTSVCMEKIQGVTTDQLIVSSYSWSPDSNLIAFSCFSITEDSVGICVYNLETNQTQKILDSEGEVYSVTWSPDGEWIAFSQRQPDTNLINVALVRFDGTEEIVFKSEYYEYVLFWVDIE